MDLPTITISTAPTTASGFSTMISGSNSMPTETKNSTAKASRSGSDSSAARWLNSDSRIIMPAKKAPSAKDTSNSMAAPKATPTAMATTPRVNSSCEPVRATHHSSLGSSRRPTTSISTTKAVTLARVMPTVVQISPAWGATAASPPCALSTPASAGSSTRTSTITRSSTTSQPTANWPLTDLSRPLASSARSSTTVLATDRHRPNTMAAPRSQPQSMATPPPSAVATAICTTAPGTAIFLTDIRSASEKCRPTPNISSITPISASWPARPTSATKPGVAGLTTMPASR